MFLPDFLVFFSFGLCYNLYQSRSRGGAKIAPAKTADNSSEDTSIIPIFHRFCNHRGAENGAAAEKERSDLKPKLPF